MDIQRKIDEVFELCQKNGRINKSDFFKSMGGLKTHGGRLIGGYENAERVAYFSLPEHMQSACDDDLVRCVKISPSDRNVYSHRDYLGSIMALGIDRDKFGDIVIENNHAFVIGFETVIMYIFDNLKSIGRTSCKLEMVSLCEIGNVQTTQEEKVISVSSIRLDCMIASAYNLSRDKAKELSQKGLVLVNGQITLKNEKQLQIDDCVSVRGFGRLVFVEQVGNSKKGKIRVKIKI